MPNDFDYQFFYEGFFGYSLEEDFSYWSLAHFMPLILLGLAIFLVYRYREFFKSWKHEETFRFILGAALIFNESFYYWRLLYVGNGGSSSPDQLITYIPLQLCEWSAYICAFMLMKKSRHLFDVVFYVCLSLGLIPLFTPAVIMHAGPGYARYYQFWLEHILPIFAVAYMMIVHGFRGSYKRVYKPFIFLGILGGLAIIANYNIEGANFMYLAENTDGDSIANLFPESIPVRIVCYVAILIMLFALLSLPEIIRDIRAKKAKKINSENS